MIRRREKGRPAQRARVVDPGQTVRLPPAQTARLFPAQAARPLPGPSRGRRVFPEEPSSSWAAWACSWC